MQNIRTPAVESDKELKAFIYQQMADIQPLVPEAKVAVTVQLVNSGEIEEMHQEEYYEEVEYREVSLADDEADEESSAIDEKEYLVSLTATFGDGQLEVEGSDKNVYIAVTKAKDILVAQLTAVQNALLDQTERDVQIQNIISGNYTLH